MCHVFFAVIVLFNRIIDSTFDQLNLIETLSCFWMIGHVLEKLVEDVEPGVGHVPHGVFESPDDGVEDELELLRGDAEEGGEAVSIDCL